MKRKPTIASFLTRLIVSGLCLLPLVVVLGFYRGTLTVFEPVKWWLFNSGVWILGGAHLINILRQHEPQTHPWPLLVPAAFSLSALTVAMLFSMAPRWSLWGSFERAQGLLAWTALACYAYLVYQYRAQHGFKERWLKTVVFSSVPVVSYALLQSVYLDPWTWQVEAGSSPVFGTLGRSNYLAGYLVLVMPLTVIETARRGLSWPQRLMRILLLLAQTVALLLSKSRAGWLAYGMILTVGLIGWGILRQRRRWWLVGLGIGLMGLGGLLGLNFGDAIPPAWQTNSIIARLSTLHVTQAGSIAARLTIWRTSWTLLKQRPLLGSGPGTFALAFARVSPPELIYYQGRETMVDQAHNLWLNLGVESGLLGTLALLALYATVAYYGWRQLRALASPTAQLRHFALLLALLGNALMDLTQPPTAATLALTWGLFSFVLPPPPTPERNPKRLNSPQHRWISFGVTLIMLCGLSWFSFRPALAGHWLARGIRTANPAAITRAQRWMPHHDVYYQKGGRFFAEQRTPESLAQAVTQLKRALALNPAQPAYWADLGTIYLTWGQHDATKLPLAETAFEVALDFNTDQTLWLQGLGKVYIAQGHLTAAESTFKRVVALDATAAQAYLHLGDLYYNQRRYNEATLAYMYARDLWLESAIPLAGLGRALAQQGRCADALPWLTQSLEIEPTGPVTYQALVRCYQATGQMGQAEAILKEGLQLYPQAQILHALQKP